MASKKHQRHAELKDMLETRRRELTQEIQGGIHAAVADGDRVRDVSDETDDAQADIQAGISLALGQMKSETLQKVNEALRRLEEGSYGDCDNCGEGIPITRLRALPFVVRCKDCEEAREAVEQNKQNFERRKSGQEYFESRAQGKMGFDA